MKQDQPRPPTLAEQLDELKRELQMRRNVYPIWYRKGKIKPEEARHRIACLEAVIRDFEQRHAPQSAQGTLGI